MSVAPLAPGEAPPLTDEEAAPPEGLPKGDERRAEMASLAARMEKLGTALWAVKRRALLVILQARDAGGKDGLIRHVFGAFNPQSMHLVSFAAPTRTDLEHGYLWRIHKEVPPRGRVGVFNRSHYEDVLVARVRGLVPENVWRRRYGQINDFERILHENGVTLLKIFLHVSQAEQKRRLLDRLEKPGKRWKFDPGDLEDRGRWDEYTEAYRDVFRQCATEHAPWHVVPADDKRARDLLAARLVAATLEAMDPQYPEPAYDAAEMLRRLEAED